MQELSTFTSEMHLSEQMFIVYLFTIFTTACIPDHDLLELGIYLKYLTIRNNCGII